MQAACLDPFFMEHVNIGRLLLLLLLGVLGCQTPPARPLPITLTPAPLPLPLGLTQSAVALTDLLPPSAAPPGRAWQWIVGNQAALLADLAAGELEAVLVEALPDDTAGLWFAPIALDGVILIAHPDNPLRDLTLAQAQALFSGRAANWRDVGGEDRPVQPIIRERGADARAVFHARVLGPLPPTIHALLAADPAAVLAAVAADPAAVGYVTVGSLSAEDARRVRVLTLEGIAADPEQLAAQRYPLTTPIYWVARAEPTGDGRAALAWLQSAAGQRVLGEKFGRIR